MSNKTRRFHSLAAGVLLLAALSLIAAGPALHRPVGVSPGDPKGVVLVPSTCPTFSWAGVEGAAGYELIVYELRTAAPTTRDSQLVIREVLPANTHSWTPPLERCLQGDRRYAWSVRTVGGDSAGEWADLRLFQVRSTPQPTEVEDALTVLRRYIAEAGGEVPPETAAEGTDGSGVDPGALENVDPETIAAGTDPPPAPTLAIDGEVSATTFSGSGTGLTGVDALKLGGLFFSAYATGTHTHTLDEFPFGTGFALTSPIRVGVCFGSTGITSSCDATCPGGTILTGGGCQSLVPVQGGTCPDANRAVTQSVRLDDTTWRCTVACNNSMNVFAGGQALCATVAAPAP